MRRHSRTFGAGVLLLSASAILLGQAPALDVRFGLWEMTATMNMTQMPAMDTSKMTPAQKAQMDAAVQSLMGPKTSVEKSCIKQEDFEVSKLFKDDDPDKNCKQTITTNTRTTLEATVACAGDLAMSAQVRIDALSPTTLKMTVQSAAEGPGAGAINVDIAGKWLGPDCMGID